MHLWWKEWEQGIVLSFLPPATKPSRHTAQPCSLVSPTFGVSMATMAFKEAGSMTAYAPSSSHSQ